METKREQEKKRKERFIIEKSRELFTTQGFEQTSMNEIVTRTSFTKRTLYKYFTNKEDLYFGVILDSYRNLWEKIVSKIDQGNTAIEKLELAVVSFQEFYKKEPTLLKLMSLTNQVNSETETPYKKKFYEFNNEMFEALGKIFSLGLVDKTIREDIDLKYTMSSFVFTITSFFNMLSLSGNSFLSYMEIDEDEFISYNLQQFLAMVKA
ncbi:TetR/AcrR family transcriptional regulator [Enterococcus sp. 669A]|uniref:TetR/AcrR family transcriptional regulator n=1 Tax=Candidatus Enterococcus moelleringii TaxID=2815325 RepID=A0ABS3LB56_9ENTE|nr:TetR/AcrR family transcriptional regulator [Enterococcus sp. 669A]MBO1306851.1 TetR/AcrR family transcriptional regulator [Enterococcus sp. 669A]